MLVTRILPVVLHIHPDILGAELAVVDGQGDDLVAREFDAPASWSLMWPVCAAITPP